jgi:NAD(P)-dependent dehydrogenase (short-subunit alcohol dehydrogenase family)
MPQKPETSIDHAHAATSAREHRGTVVAITGGSSGIGRCTAGLFVRHGWRVGLIARGEMGLQTACKDVEHHGALVAMAQADVTDPVALEAAATAIEEALGGIDVWVNCAGNRTYGRFLDTSPRNSGA